MATSLLSALHTTTPFTPPLSLGILLLALFALLLPYLPGWIARVRGQQPGDVRLIFGEGNED